MSMCGEKENVQREIATKEEELFALTKEITDLQYRLKKLEGFDRHYIRPMTHEERQRSKEREAINHVHR